jgi:hypothetical protein
LRSTTSTICSDPVGWKPQTCWHIPLFSDIDEDATTTTVRACRIVDWGEEGILDWCAGCVQR